MLRGKTWVAAGVLAGAVTFFGGAAAIAAGGWTRVSAPAISSNTNTDLHGVFARTDTDAWAVGQVFVAAGQPPSPPAIYHWNGTAWSLVSSPALPSASSLGAVSASSATDAWAVGVEFLGRHNNHTLLEHWNGTAWSVDTADSVPGGLGAVLDLSPTNAYAVGRANGSVLEHWNGTSWSPVTLPDPSFAPGGGQDISATSATDIWLAGTSAGQAEALHFNGTAWTVVPMAQPQPGPINPAVTAVTAISPNDAWAVGDNGSLGTLTEHWNGASWSIVPSPTPGFSPHLSGVAARSANDVYAVGTAQPSINGGPFQAVILRWNGTSWSDDTGGTITRQLEAAATFPGAAREWAVGIDGNNQALILSHS